MFLIWWILKKIREKNEKKQAIKEIIAILHIDEKQKQLYYESLEVIDQDWLESLYMQLTALINIIEEDELKQNYKEAHNTLSSVKREENLEKQREINSLELLLNNV